MLSITEGYTYTLLSDLLAPVKPGSEFVEQFTQVLVKYYNPKLPIDWFNAKNQALTETLAETKLANFVATYVYGSYGLRWFLACGYM